MYNLNFFLLGVCLFVAGTFCDEAPMLEMIIKECNFSKVYDESQIDTLKTQPELKECKNWTAISSINSSKQFSDDNMSNIRCLLYYESLIPICKNVSNLEKLHKLLTAKPEETYTEDFCKSLLSSESQSTIHNVVTNNYLCERLCTEIQDGEPVLKEICVKSYNFNKFLLEQKRIESPLAKNIANSVPIEHIAKEGDLVDQKIPNQLPVVASLDPVISSPEHSDNVPPEKKESQTGDAIEKIKEDAPIPESNNIVEKPVIVLDGNVNAKQKKDSSDKIEDKLVAYISPKPQVVNSFVPAQKKDKKVETNSANPAETQNVASQPANNELAPPNVDDLINSVSKPSTVANNKVSKVQDSKDDQVKSDPENDNIDAENREQALPKIEDPNTLGAGDYEFDQEKPEQINDPKQGDGDFDDAVPDTDKMPKVSQLSEQFRYDADVNGNSNFFPYFSFTCVIFIIGYVVYHNKTKVLALLVEGRHSRRTQRVRRPNVANYQKLDSNLEEAISSSVSKNPSHVIY